MSFKAEALKLPSMPKKRSRFPTSASKVSLERYWQERNVYDANQYEKIMSEMRHKVEKLKSLSDDRNKMLHESGYTNYCIQNAINKAKIARNQRKRTALMLKLEALVEKRYLGKRASSSQANQTKAVDRKKALPSNKIFDKIDQHIEKKKSLSKLAGSASNFDSGWNFSGVRRVYISYNHSCLCGGEFPTIPCNSHPHGMRIYFEFRETCSNPRSVRCPYYCGTRYSGSRTSRHVFEVGENDDIVKVDV